MPAFNGFFLEWGDELYCLLTTNSAHDKARCKELSAYNISAAWRNYPKIATASMIIGLILSPFGMMVIASSRNKSAGDAFKAGAGVELLEGIVCAAGE